MFTGLLSSPTVSLETSVLFGGLKGVGRDRVCGRAWARVPECAIGVWLWRDVMAAGGRQSGLEGFIIFVFSKTVILQSPEICRYVAEVVQAVFPPLRHTWPWPGRCPPPGRWFPELT